LFGSSPVAAALNAPVVVPDASTSVVPPLPSAGVHGAAQTTKPRLLSVPPPSEVTVPFSVAPAVVTPVAAWVVAVGAIAAAALLRPAIRKAYGRCCAPSAKFQW
jgi:hypothetical protein